MVNTDPSGAGDGCDGEGDCDYSDTNTIDVGDQGPDGYALPGPVELSLPDAPGFGTAVGSDDNATIAGMSFMDWAQANPLIEVDMVFNAPGAPSENSGTDSGIASLAITGVGQMSEMGQALFTDPALTSYWRNAGGAVNFLGWSTIGVVAAPAVAANAPAWAGAVANRVLLGPALNRVFWYGAGYFGASSYAATSEGTILGETPMGRILDLFTKPQGGGFGFGYEVTMQPYWAAASRMFAQGAQGPVVMFPGITANPASIWFTEELPTLANRGTEIIVMGP